MLKFSQYVVFLSQLTSCVSPLCLSAPLVSRWTKGWRWWTCCRLPETWRPRRTSWWAEDAASFGFLQNKTSPFTCRFETLARPGSRGGKIRELPWAANPTAADFLLRRCLSELIESPLQKPRRDFWREVKGAERQRPPRSSAAGRRHGDGERERDGGAAVTLHPAWKNLLCGFKAWKPSSVFQTSKVVFLRTMGTFVCAVPWFSGIARFRVSS